MSSIPEFSTVIDLLRMFDTEAKCSAYIALQRWGTKPVCPHCGYDEKIYKFEDGIYYKCAGCKKKFTVRIGTMFGDSKIPLVKWFAAMYFFTSNSKGISSVQLAKQIGVTQKSAWFMLHRLRHGMDNEDFKKPLEGVVEADETLIYGQEKNKHQKKRNPDGLGGDSSLNGKMAVFGAVERKGHVRAYVIEDRKLKTLEKMVVDNVSPVARVITDEHLGYSRLKELGFMHDTINHSSQVYVVGDVHTNTIENFWSTLKRGIYGIYHFTSKKHLNRYLQEFSYRYNHRNESDSKKFNLLLLQSNVGQLEYSALIGKEKKVKAELPPKNNHVHPNYGFELPPDYFTNMDIGPF